MANPVDPQAQIKLIEISEKWAEKMDTRANYEAMTKGFLEKFDTIYKALVKTITEK